MLLLKGRWRICSSLKQWLTLHISLLKIFSTTYWILKSFSVKTFNTCVYLKLKVRTRDVREGRLFLWGSGGGGVGWAILRGMKYFSHLQVNSGAPAAEGRQAEPHTHIRKLKGTHELIFSCVSWLAVLLVGAYARRRRRRWWSRATWRPQLTRKPKRGFSFRGLSL